MVRPVSCQKGFALIVSMLILLVLTILVVNAVRNTSLNEKMAGNYMDRTRAQQAAEQVLRQGVAALTHENCSASTGCTLTSLSTAPTSPGPAAVNAMPASWSSVGAMNMIPYPDPNNPNDTGKNIPQQLTSAQLSVALLADTFLPAGKAGCKAYSLMGRGVGLDSRSVVILQTVAYVCDI